MFLRLLLLFFTVPLLELYVLVLMTKYFSLWTTIVIVLSTGVIGASLARHQGLRALQRVQLQLSQGKMPSQELLDGALIVFAGTFLITPGLLTDTLGFCLLIPQFRSWIGRQLQAWFLNHAGRGMRSSAWSFQVYSGSGVMPGDVDGHGQPTAVDDLPTEAPSIRVIDPKAPRIPENS